MGSSSPRVVIITRETEYELLLTRHSTREQTEFFLESRGETLQQVLYRHQLFEEALQTATSAIPVEWRKNRVLRSDLDRFLFEPHDLVMIVGQDGLVANVAKYLDGQHVLGINPNPEQYDGILVPLPPEATGELLKAAMKRELPTESRTMVEATLDDGQKLLALNELFLGHQTHQSARYRIEFESCEERHSSSGIIVTTGTGATGWARSISRQRAGKFQLPMPEEETLSFFVREAFPSIFTGTSLTDGTLTANHKLRVTSEMNEGGVIFGDGIEEDRIEFSWGTTAEVTISSKKLELIQG